MKITAILSIRNEEANIANCLRHLIENGLDFIVIDNQSTDRTRDIATRSEFSTHLIDLITHPYPGYFDWTGLMEAREKAANNCTADWVLFVSADEIMHSYTEAETLEEGISRVAKTGADVIDFNEFVFLPINKKYQSDIFGHQQIEHYYFFEPHKPRLMRARRRDMDVSHIKGAGHVLSGKPFKLAQESFALRHYIFRDQHHANAKYQERVFAKVELQKGWHGNRFEMEKSGFIFPDPHKLKKIQQFDQHNLDRSEPYKLHYWQW